MSMMNSWKEIVCFLYLFYLEMDLYLIKKIIIIIIIKYSGKMTLS